MRGLASKLRNQYRILSSQTLLAPQTFFFFLFILIDFFSNLEEEEDQRRQDLTNNVDAEDNDKEEEEVPLSNRRKPNSYTSKPKKTPDVGYLKRLAITILHARIHDDQDTLDKLSNLGSSELNVKKSIQNETPFQGQDLDFSQGWEPNDEEMTVEAASNMISTQEKTKSEKQDKAKKKGEEEETIERKNIGLILQKSRIIEGYLERFKKQVPKEIAKQYKKHKNNATEEELEGIIQELKYAVFMKSNPNLLKTTYYQVIETQEHTLGADGLAEDIRQDIAMQALLDEVEINHAHRLYVGPEYRLLLFTIIRGMYRRNVNVRLPKSPYYPPPLSDVDNFRVSMDQVNKYAHL